MSKESLGNVLSWVAAAFYAAVAAYLAFAGGKPLSYGAILMSIALTAYFAPPVRKWVVAHTPFRFNPTAMAVVAVAGVFGVSAVHNQHLEQVAKSQAKAAAASASEAGN